MLWWKGKLYVGTNRAWHCAERAGLHSAFPWFVRYPSDDPDAECTRDPSDLPLQAEIWRWTPETDEWERVYQSPRDVPIQGRPGKYVAREVGFRHMAVFVEPDGAEAMYVSGVNARFIFRPVPPPRLLRSTDGFTFEPVPQDPGTFMGELDTCAFRTITIYRGRLFVLTGTIQGDGILLESSNPAGGNDHFRQVSPPGMKLFEMTPFNGYLYLGLRDPKRGYAVMKTDATGSPPYTFIPVVTDGAFLSQPSRGVISMHTYKGRLYVGTDRPCTEVIRINPDDTWDLVIGPPRETPDGWKYPLSGLDAGFSNWLNGHIWRMQEYNGRLYIGTFNMSTHLREFPGLDPVLKPNYGFDFFETADGWHYAPITLTGFDDKFNCGLRSFAVTPYGLFVGTANNWYGLQIWRGTPKDHPADEAAAQCQPPERLEVERHDNQVLLSWEHPGGAKRFRIWRANVTDERRAVEAHPFLAPILRVLRRAILPVKPDLYLPPLPDKLWIPGAYTEIGVTEQLYYSDWTTVVGQRYLYYVRAENEKGELSTPSNVVAVPPLTPPVTFKGLLQALDGWTKRGRSEAAQDARGIREEILKARACLAAGDVAGASDLLQQLSDQSGVSCPKALDPLFLDDLQILLLKLRRRIGLSQAGIIPVEILEAD